MKKREKSPNSQCKTSKSVIRSRVNVSDFSGVEIKCEKSSNSSSPAPPPLTTTTPLPNQVPSFSNAVEQVEDTHWKNVKGNKGHQVIADATTLKVESDLVSQADVSSNKAFTPPLPPPPLPIASTSAAPFINPSLNAPPPQLTVKRDSEILQQTTLKGKKKGLTKKKGSTAGLTGDKKYIIDKVRNLFQIEHPNSFSKYEAISKVL